MQDMVHLMVALELPVVIYLKQTGKQTGEEAASNLSVRLLIAIPSFPSLSKFSSGSRVSYLILLLVGREVSRKRVLIRVTVSYKR